ncbi:sensor histidine kinase [Deinococcus aestuarii]|uniref:sensor histidine kinase n=1 Tax=Deinococcus aestuarii TaxID=2774531 RepID=UPI001C0D23A9|nr:HAMP domain-containing sensor histidine kinase [Deinococcus aestuarii]
MSLRARLILLATLTLAAAVVLVVALSGLALTRLGQQAVEEELDRQAVLLMQEANTSKGLGPAIARLLTAETGAAAGQIYRDDRLVWSDGPYGDRAPQPLDARFFDDSRETRMCRCGPWIVASRRSGDWTVQVGRPTTALDLTVRHYLVTAGVISVLVVVIFGLLLVILMRRAMWPLTALAERMRRLDTSAPVPYQYEPGEVGVLARAMHHSLAELRAVRELEARFLADASHELRTPVTALMTVLEHALDRPRSPQEQHRALERALRNARHLRQLTTDLLTLSRARFAPGRLELDLRQLANEVVDRLMPLAVQKGLDVEVDGVPAPFQGDPVLVSRLIENLLGNAIKFTDEGSIRIDVHPVSDEVEVTVEDDGVGVTPEQIARLQEPFQRGGDQRREGFGLGLAVVRSVAEAHGGWVKLEGRPQGGTRATVRLARRPPRTLN